jgi:hypothetical protein
LKVDQFIEIEIENQYVIDLVIEVEEVVVIPEDMHFQVLE